MLLIPLTSFDNQPKASTIIKTSGESKKNSSSWLSILTDNNCNCTDTNTNSNNIIHSSSQHQSLPIPLNNRNNLSSSNHISCYNKNHKINSNKKQSSSFSSSNNSNCKCVESFGIIPYRFVNNSIQYLLICRHVSFGFSEFLRGNYSKNDYSYIYGLLEEMTKTELNMVGTVSFDKLWLYLTFDTCQSMRQERYYELSTRLTFLQSSESFQKVINSPKMSKWNSPEWGFPKGRKEFHETSIACAMRELCEETKLSKQRVKINTNINAYSEQFEGTDQKKYRHTYYSAEILNELQENTENETETETENENENEQQSQSQLQLQLQQHVTTVTKVNDIFGFVDPNDISQLREVSALQWVSFEEAKLLIRPYDTKKIEILESLEWLLSSEKKV